MASSAMEAAKEKKFDAKVA